MEKQKLRETSQTLIKKNLRNKKVQSFSELVDIPTDSSASITIQYDNNQHVSTCKQLQQQATPLMFSEMSGEDPDKIWENVNLKLHSVFGHDEKLKSQNDNDKRYCLLLLSTLQNWAFANKYPVDTWIKKAKNTFGNELEQIENFNLVGESSMVQSKKRANDDNIRQVKKSKLEKEEKDPKWQKIADLLLTSGVEVSHSANQLVISENNNSIEFGDDANSIKMGLVQWKSRDDFLHLTQNRLDLEKLKHFLNLKQAYTAYKKFVNQSMPRGSKTKTIKYKIENNIPLGKDSSKKSRWGWISAKIQSILNIDSSAERKTRSALRFVDLLLSENLVTLESLVATKASPDFFKRMSASIKLKFYRRLKRDENAKFEVGDSDDSELESENDCEGNENNIIITKRCPFCNVNFPAPLPPHIESYLTTLSGSPDVIYQHEFCRLHDAEFHIVPDGQQKNYPLTIDFENLPSRVKDMFPELLNIAVGKTKSLFRDLAIDAYNTLGIGVKKPTALMGRFLNFIPGYYGTKGMSVIQSTLSTLIISNELTYEMTKPQSPDEYLNEVLVPEAAIRLIAQDRQIGLDEAKKVMEDSVEFGMYVHDIELEDLET